MAALLSGTPVLAGEEGEELKAPCTEFDLPNGLHVILHEDHRTPIVCTNIWYGVGSSYEQPGRTGFAHLFEHLMFEGSAHVKKGQFDSLLEQIGGSFNATTSFDRTNYFCTVPSGALELPLFLESDRMGYLLDSMSLNIVDSQRDVVKNEMRQRYLNAPYMKILLEYVKLLYLEGHPYSWPVIGSMEDLSAAGYEDVVNFYKTYYVPNNASLAVVGDIDTAKAKELVEKWFSEIKIGKEVKRPAAEPFQLKGIIKKTIPDNVVNLSRVLLWPTPAVFEPGNADLDVLCSILTADKNSRISKKLEVDRQLVSFSYARQFSNDLGSHFTIRYRACSGHSLDEIQAIIFEELKKIQNEPPSQAEIDKAVNKIEHGFLADMEDCQDKADKFNNYYRHFGKADSFSEDLERYRRVTPQSVSDCAKRYLDLEKYVEISAIPEKEAK